FFFSPWSADPRALHSFPTRRSSDLAMEFTDEVGGTAVGLGGAVRLILDQQCRLGPLGDEVGHGQFAACQAQQTAVKNVAGRRARSEEHTSELQSQSNLVCRLLLEKK